MRIYDPFLFLVGNRGAIERVAGSWWSLFVGALFVITAGIARNYDHIDFTSNAEWIVGPFIASILSSLFIFLLGCWRFMYVKGAKLSYLSFLSLYWMTSPCAWLYGIPVESFADILTATKWNVTFLAVVSVWRVVLMIRCLHVLSKDPLITNILRILFPASVVMMVASFFKGMDLVSIMGGVRLSPHEAFLYQASNFTTIVSFWTAIVCFVLAVAFIGVKRNTQPLPWRSIPAPKSTITLACSIIALFLLAATPFQRQARHTAELQRLFNKEQYRAAIDYAAQFERTNFLQSHYLPPKNGRFGQDELIMALVHLKPSDPSWIEETWISQINTNFGNQHQFDRFKEKFFQASDSSVAISSQREQLWEKIKTTHNLPDKWVDE